VSTTYNHRDGIGIV